MSSVRKIRRATRAAQLRHIEALGATEQPNGEKALQHREAVTAAEEMLRSVVEGADEAARSRRQRSLAATAQGLVVLLAFGALGLAGWTVVTRPQFMVALGLGSMLLVLATLVVGTWWHVLRGSEDGAPSDGRPGQLVLESLDAYRSGRRRRRIGPS